MINWLVQSMADLPALPAEAWLSPPERERLCMLRVEKKRQEWLLGRWTAKQLVRSALAQEGPGPVDMIDISIVAAPDGAPELRIGPHPASLTAHPSLSISHSGGRALCALGPAGVRVGADIEAVAPRGAGFAADYFTPAELAHLEAAPAALRDMLVTAVWSAKEAALKALRRGLTVDTRLVECLPPLAADGAPNSWAPFTARCHPSLGAPPAGLSCWWRRYDTFVLTLAAAGEPPAAS